MYTVYFASSTSSSGSVLGLSPKVFMFQIVTFALVFFILKKYALSKVVAMLDERYKTIDEGVHHGLQMRQEREEFEQRKSEITKKARLEADEIVSNAQKEAKSIVKEAEQTASEKSDIMINDAKSRIDEEVDKARRSLEKDMLGLVSEATEAVVGEKIDTKKDTDLINKALKAGIK